MKIYTSGKIAGLDESVFRANFDQMVRHVEQKGHEALNPLDVGACPTEDCNGARLPRLANGSYLHTWSCYLKYDIIAMLSECDAILMDQNYLDSRGAQFELEIAIKCGLDVFYFWKDIPNA